MNETTIKVGDKVKYSPIIGKQPLDKVHTVLRLDSVCGEPVAFLTEKSACVSVDALTLVK